jgi:omega-amidase
MVKGNLHICLLQTDIVWENPAANRAALSDTILALDSQPHIIVLPEMFSTGFSMQPHQVAETMDGATVQWMQTMAAQKKCILSGSVMIHEDGHYYNRLLWVLPNGQIAHYDKRHLFSYAGEDKHYTPGNKRLIAQVNGWKICLQICYDLRFPVWARNTDDYDILLYVANWPMQRNEVWETLLKARAIENMCYVVGVNRVGTDANGHQYIGNSSIYSPLGALIEKAGNVVTTLTYSFAHSMIEDSRQQFPFLQDKDDFLLR